MDMSTLKKRLQLIAAEVQRKTRDQGHSSRDGRYSDRTSQMQSSQRQQHGMRSDPSGGASPFMGSSSQNGGRMGNMDEGNSMSNSANSSSMMRQSGGPSGGYHNERGSSAQQSSSSNRNDPEWKMRIKHKQQRLLLLHHSAKCPHEDGRCTVTQHCADMKRLWRHMEGCKDNNCRVPHCFSSRAILSHYRKCKDPTCPACGPVRQSVRKSKGQSSGSGSPGMSMGSSSMRMSSGPPSQHSMMQSDPLVQQQSSFASASSSVGGSSFQQPRAGHPMAPPGSSSSRQYSSQYQQSNSSVNGSSSSVQPVYRSSNQGSSVSHSSPGSRSNELSLPNHRPDPSGSGRNDSEWQKIRHKQQRLLLLRHASRCQHEAGKCPVTPHCASMKKLWEHIAHCKNQQCTVQHCLSSRYVLSHYRRCKDPNCPACGPVRETIRKSHEREKSRQQPPGSAPPMDMDRSMSNTFAPSSSQSHSPVADPYQPERKRAKIDHHPAEAPSMPPRQDLSADLPPSTVPAPPSSSAEVVKQAAAKVEPGGKKTAEGKGAPDHSLLNSFTVKQLETHLTSLDRKTQLPQAKLKSKCQDVLKGLQTHQHGWVFNSPVDPDELGLPDYFEIIKKPMDLGTVQKRVESGAYHDIPAFEADVMLTFDNAMTYNEDGSVVYDMAKELKSKFETDMQKLLEQLEQEDLERRQNDRACTLCGCEKLLFEPPVYFCNGMNCQSQRIRRNSHFYIAGNNQYFWCTSCYNELDEKIPIELVDMSIMKADLKKKKNDEVHEESWVQCDDCERWVHQICGLFNTRQNREQHSEYCCPRCLYSKQKKKQSVPSEKPPGAADLPRTTLSEWLEKHIMKKVENRRRQLAEEKAQTEVSRELLYSGSRSNLPSALTLTSFVSPSEYHFRGRHRTGRIWGPYIHSAGYLYGPEARSS